MPRFEVEGTGKRTGRKRKRVYSAVNLEAARKMADEDQTQIERITELPPDPPTERQLAYAKDLGIEIPTDATKADVSDLISLKTEEDKPASERHKGFAQLYHVEASRFTGKRALFDRIQSTLVHPGREKDLLSWFTYRVYRQLTSASDDAPIKGPDDPVIQEIAAQLAADEKIVKSVRRYSGQELIFFGEWTSPNGSVHTGGSNRTAAYKQVSELLREKASFPQKRESRSRVASASRRPRGRSSKQNQGCSPAAMAILLVVSIFIILVLL